MLTNCIIEHTGFSTRKRKQIEVDRLGFLYIYTHTHLYFRCRLATGSRMYSKLILLYWPKSDHSINALLHDWMIVYYDREQACDIITQQLITQRWFNPMSWPLVRLKLLTGQISTPSNLPRGKMVFVDVKLGAHSSSLALNIGWVCGTILIHSFIDCS